ncbi:MAG: hypothetical protein ACOYMG_16405, partial [Candidatus Methylumidiphilus sp.]
DRQCLSVEKLRRLWFCGVYCVVLRVAINENSNWFNALKDLLNLRSSVAKTDDAAREMRGNDQTTGNSDSSGNGTAGT